MANGFPVKTSFQANDPLAASQLNALGEAINQSGAAVATTAGDIVYSSAANTLARLAKGTAGQVLRMNSGATAPEWGAGFSIYTAEQSSNYTITSSYADVTGLSASVTTQNDGDIIAVLVVGEMNLPANSSNLNMKIVSDTTDGDVRVFRYNGSDSMWESFAALEFFTIATADTFDVKLQVERSAGAGTILKSRMMVFVL